jgi:lactoylglutathione lyase
MDFKKVANELKKEYPGAKIIPNQKDNPTEVLCEIDPSSKHTGFSSVVSVIDQAEPHSHQYSAEIYYVLRGKLELLVENQRFVLNQDEYRVIPPNTVHSATGKETWVLVYSEPGWREDDHHLIKDKPLSFIPHITHLRLLVVDYGAMFKFYRETLGLTVKWGEPTGNYAEFDLGDVSLGLFKRKLMAEVLPKALGDSLLKILGRVVLNLKVEDVDASFTFLSQKGVKFVKEPNKYPEWGIKAAHLEDPEGNILEIYQNLK